MTVRNIRKLGDPVLRAKAKEVTEFDEKIHGYLQDMAETMAHYSGVGLAAPQIGLDLAMVVIKLGEDFPLLELINPRIVESSGEDIAVEGCLSIPGVHGEVKRSAEVEVQFQDRMGRKKTMRASGFLARAVQHELDHLQGVLFIDKVIRYVTEED
ncbi:MAG: peptide deformylase [Firmicutes bacterium]|nr:peptide deformylase [Bacillota bacterium]